MSKPEDSRAAGLEKAAEIAEYHRDKYGDKAVPAWKAACDEIIVSCLATAGRIRRGEYENPTSVVMAEPEFISDEDFQRLIQEVAPDEETQRAFAHEFEVSVPTVRRWASGAAHPARYIRVVIRDFALNFKKTAPDGGYQCPKAGHEMHEGNCVTCHNEDPAAP